MKQVHYYSLLILQDLLDYSMIEVTQIGSYYPH